MIRACIPGKKWRGGNNRKGKGTASIDSTAVVTKRMLSARRLKINELKNEVEELHTQLNELRNENKTLRRQQVLSERELDKHEAQESDVSNILQKHNEEVCNNLAGL